MKNKDLEFRTQQLRNKLIGNGNEYSNETVGMLVTEINSLESHNEALIEELAEMGRQLQDMGERLEETNLNQQLLPRL